MTKANMDKVKEGLEHPPAITPSSPLEALLSKENTRKRFSDVLGKKTAGFLSSVLSAYNTNSALQECEPGSVLSSAMIAATLDLPINANLGWAAIIPYKGVATFQIMKKGLVQLALRSGLYATLNAETVYEGELKYSDKFKGVYEFDPNGKKSNKVIGYVAYLRLLNGFEKYVYITREDAEKHAKKFSQAYRKNYGPWVDDFDAMGEKTVLKALISNWGPQSIEMQKAIEFDQAAVVDDRPAYIDNGDKVLEVEGVPAEETAGEEQK